MVNQQTVSSTRMRRSQLGILQDEDHRILKYVDRGLQDATELYRWWLRAEETNAFERIPVVRQLNSTNTNYTFLSEAPLTRGVLPVVGLVQDVFYDRPKSDSDLEYDQADWYCQQIQEFMMRYFMRVSTSRKFRLSIEGAREAAGQNDPDIYGQGGWGYYQSLYKIKSTGKVGKFPPGHRFKIVDLREIGKKYEWIVFKIRFFDFIFQESLLGADGPRLEVPVVLDNYVVINSDFVINRDNPSPGVLGEYGFGTPVVPVPDPNSILAYGPSGLSEAFQFIVLRVLESGEVRAKLVLVANRPTRIIKFDPVDWGFQIADLLSLGTASHFLAPIKNVLKRIPIPQFAPLLTFAGLANSATGGLAEEQFCVSRNQIYRSAMALHGLSLYRFITQTVPIWDSVPNWLDKEQVPEWALEGAQPRMLTADDTVDSMA